jgi:hypothetical protein
LKIIAYTIGCAVFVRLLLEVKGVKFALHIKEYHVIILHINLHTYTQNTLDADERNLAAKVFHILHSSPSLSTTSRSSHSLSLSLAPLLPFIQCEMKNSFWTAFKRLNLYFVNGRQNVPIFSRTSSPHFPPRWWLFFLLCERQMN